MAKVEVIIPTYNRAHLIERAIDSVLKQSFKDFQLTVVDDGSSDNTLDVLRAYGGQIKVIKSSNQGVSHARNLAIKNSKAKWIAFLDSDDEWLTHRLQSQMEFLERYPDYKIVHGDEIWIRNSRRVNPKKKHKKFGGDLFKASLSLCLISPSASLIKKELLIQVGLFREDFEVCEDYDLWLKISKNNMVGYIEDSIIIKYGGHEDQLSRKYFAMDWWRLVSMADIFCQEDLSETNKRAIAEVFKEKYRILKFGYIKHSRYEELTKLEALAQKVLPPQNL